MKSPRSNITKTRWQGLSSALAWKHFDECCQVFKCLITVELIGRVGKAEAGNLLNVSVPALNGRIKTLENFLDSPIFAGARSSILTPIGQEVRKLWNPQIQQLLQDFSMAVGRLHDQNNLNISVDRSIWAAEGNRLRAAYSVRMPLGAIHAAFEDVPIAVENRIRDGEIDLGLVSFREKDEKIAPPVKRHFWRNEPMVLVVERERATRLSSKIEVAPSDFGNLHHTFLTMAEDSRMYNNVSTYLRRLKISRCFDYKVPVQDVKSALAQVIEDRGVTIVPERMAAEAEAQGKIEVFLLRPPLERRLDFLYLENGLKKASVNAFLDCLGEGKKPKYLPLE